ncbi:MAG: glutamate racemase [Epulopiscium sp. Nele67-Bin005]|nr:MAG: glutamate racemase [Epulopiscium sp. Nele67-Bin005]
MDNRPIGIFDSGVGGLTVVKEVMNQLKNESIIYFGDTARVPYGSKSKHTVTKFSAQIIRFLLEQDVKAIIIACNTVNSNCIDELRELFPNVLIEGVVESGVKMAIDATSNNKIGVIGTEATISSGKYPELIKQSLANSEVFVKSCPLFVPLVEEGWLHHEVTRLVAKEYLESLLNKQIDTLILGCTHYPIIQDSLQQVVGEHVKLINPADETARFVGTLLIKHNLQSNNKANYEFFVSDHVRQVQQMAEMFLGYPIHQVKKIEIEKY